MLQKVSPPLSYWFHSEFYSKSYNVFYLNGREKTKSLRWCFWCKTSLWNTCSTPTSPMSRRCYVRHKGGHFLSESCPPIGCIDQNRYKKSLFPLLCGRSRSTWSIVLFPWGAEQECVPMQMWRQEEEFRGGCEPPAGCSAALLQSTQRLSCQHETLSSGWNIQWLLQKYLQQLPDVSKHLHPGKKHPVSPAYPPNSRRPPHYYEICTMLQFWRARATLW